MQPDGQHSLRELAGELHRSKRTLQLWAQALPDDMKQQSSGGAIMVNDAGAELLRQRAAQRPAQSAKLTAQSDCAPREISQEIARETAKNPRNDAENREIFAPYREIGRETAKNGREIAREISHPIAYPDSSTDALALALDTLQQTIDRQAAELLRVREELTAAEARAADADKRAAVFSEKLDGLQRNLAAEQDRTAQQAAEIAAQQQTIDKLTEQLAAAQAAQADTAAQLAAIADKQADALRAGAAEQLALAIPEQPEPEPERRGFFARLFHRKRD